MADHQAHRLAIPVLALAAKPPSPLGRVFHQSVHWLALGLQNKKGPPVLLVSKMEFGSKLYSSCFINRYTVMYIYRKTTVERGDFADCVRVRPPFLFTYVPAISENTHTSQKNRFAYITLVNTASLKKVNNQCQILHKKKREYLSDTSSSCLCASSCLLLVCSRLSCRRPRSRPCCLSSRPSRQPFGRPHQQAWV